MEPATLTIGSNVIVTLCVKLTSFYRMNQWVQVRCVARPSYVKVRGQRSRSTETMRCEVTWLWYSMPMLMLLSMMATRMARWTCRLSTNLLMHCLSVVILPPAAAAAARISHHTGRGIVINPRNNYVTDVARTCAVCGCQGPLVDPHCGVATHEVSCWAAVAPRALGTSIPQWSPGQSPGRGSGDFVPEVEAVCRHCLQILTAETIKIRNWWVNWHPNSWPVCFVGGISDIFRGLSPLKPMPGSTTGSADGESPQRLGDTNVWPPFLLSCILCSLCDGKQTYLLDNCGYHNYTVNRKKHTKLFVISSIKPGQFWWNLVPIVLSKFTMQYSVKSSTLPE